MTQAPGTVPGCPVDGSFDPLAPDFLADPYEVMAKLPREERPVFFATSIGYYVLTRYADIEQVFQDPASYSAAVAQAPLVPLVPEAQRILLAGGHKPQPSMVSLDEPEHARLRKPAARAFSMKRVAALVPVIEATTARLLDAVGPATADQVEIASGMAAYRAYLHRLVDAKVNEPGDDLTSDLIAIHRENPRGPGFSSGWRRPAGIPRPSASPMCSTSAGPTPRATWLSARACTTAWARTSAGWKRR